MPIGFCLTVNNVDHHSTDPSSIMFCNFTGWCKKKNPYIRCDRMPTAVYGSSTGVEDYIFFYSGPTTITQNSYSDYSVLFSDQPPLGNYIVGGISLSILVEHGEGEYVAATGGPDIIYLGTLPYGYYWLRTTSGNVLGRVKAVGTDDQGIVHTAYYPITISGVANNTTSGTLVNNETWGGINNIIGNVIVPSGITLKSLPSSTVKFPSNVSLTVNGTLNAQAPYSLLRQVALPLAVGAQLC